jgi:hypothetical protein
MAQIITIDNQEAYPDKVLCLGFKEARQYNFNMTDYTKVQVGWMASLVKASNLRPDTFGNLNVESGGDKSSGKDSVWFGFKKADSLFPSDTSFAGVRTAVWLRQSNPPLKGMETYFNYGNNTSGGDYGTIINGVDGLVEKTAPRNIFPAYYGCYNPNSANSDNGIAIFNMLELTVNNAGTATQSVTLKANMGGSDMSRGPWPLSGGVYDEGAMLSALGDYGSSLQTVGTYNLHSGGAPLDLLDAFFFYWPHSDTRLCLHGVVIQKVS